MDLDEHLQALYRRSPKLAPAYISEILGLRGAQVEAVARISGGISAEEARLVAETVGELGAACTLEVGLGYGFPALAICAAADRRSASRRHIVMDPHQHTHWGGAGLRNLVEAGYEDCVEFHEQVSFRMLPQLERQGVTVDFAFVDGWHTFDHVFVDFFYIDRLLREGGVVAFDDADWPSIRPVIRYAVTNLPYSVYKTLPEKKERLEIDHELGLEGSCIAIRKERTESARDVFFHNEF